MRRVAVVGAGVAGSNLAAWLAKLNFDGEVHVYDPQGTYRKPCGNVLLPEALDFLPLRPEVTNEVNEYEVWVNGRRVAHFTAGDHRWLIVDKEKLVEELRGIWRERYVFHRKASDPHSLSRGYDIVVDARGPYSDNILRRVLVARGIFEPREEVGDKIVLNFDTEAVGLYWAFPFKDKVNVGYGAVWARDPLIKLRSFTETTGVAKFDRKAVRSAPLTMDYPILQVRDKNVVRVGEALGLVLALGGEGNRYALISSKLLAEAIHRSEDLATLKGKIRGILVEATKQALALDMILHMRDRRKIDKAMGELSPGFYRQFLFGRFSLLEALRASLKAGVIWEVPLGVYLRFIGGMLRLII